jgi:hypothetical protein
VAYATKEYLFCSACSNSRDCLSITPEEVEKFFLTTAPDYITVDAPPVFVEASSQWLLWLCRQPALLAHSKAIEKLLHKVERDAINSMSIARGAASKCHLLEALSAGVDPADNDAILQYFVKDAPERHDYFEELLVPPHPVFNKGRMLYLYGWPPDKNANQDDPPSAERAKARPPR